VGGTDFLDEGFDDVDFNAWRPQVKRTGEGFNDEYPKPEDYVAVVAAIYDIGIQVGWGGVPKDQVAVVFELDAQKSNGYPHVVIQRITKSMYEKAPFYRLICAAFPGEDHQGFRVRDLIGKSVYGTVTVSPNKTNPDRKIVKFINYMKLPRGLASIAVRGDYTDPPRLVMWMAEHAITSQDAEERARASEAQAKQDAEAFDA